MKRLKQLLEGLGRTVTRWLGIGAVGAAGVCGTLSLAAEPVPPSVPRETGLCLDRSPSMQGARFRAARQGAKLFINLLGDERLRTVGFAGDAVTDEFRLKDGRSEAMKWIDHLEHAPCTDYGAALKACRWGDETPIIILGDGEQTIGSPQDVVDYVTNRLPRGVTLHTFAAGCQPGSEAERLLSRMAAMTGGSFAHIRDSEEMVRAFVETAIRVGNYRGCTPSEDVLEFDAASGRVVAFAYDGEVAFELDGKPLPPVVEYDAQLPGEDVQVRTVVLNAPGRLTVRLVNPRTKNSRLGTVLRTDKPRAELLIESHDGRVQPGSTVPAEILFEKRSGEEFDPRDTVEAEIELIDERGNVLHRASAVPSDDKPALEAELPFPDIEGPVTAVATTRLREDGEEWVEHDRVTVIAEQFLQLVTRPERLQETTRVGRFDVELEVDVTGGPVPGDVAARLESEHDGLELIAAEPVDGGLVLRFDGRQAGAHVGVLRVSHTNPRVVSRGVRFGFDIGGNSEAEAQEIDVDLGTVVAGHGVLKVSIPLRVSDTDPARYQVLVRDLARGGTVLPTTAPRTLEVERTGARLIVEVEIGDVPAGEYGGALVMTPKGQAGKRWNVLLKLAVTNALQADVLDFGIVGAGTIATARGIIRNRSAKSVTGVTISLPTSMAHEDRPVQGLEFRAEERIGEIPAGQERSVEVTVAVPDTIGVRGDVTGRVLVNSDGTTIEVPVRMKLVNAEAVPARFRVIPSRLELTGPAGRVIRFSLRLRASPDVQRAHTIRVEAQPLTKSDGSRSTAVVDFGKTTEVTLFPDRPLDLTGMVLLPETGAAQSELVLSGAGAGRVVVPVMLKTR